MRLLVSLVGFSVVVLGVYLQTRRQSTPADAEVESAFELFIKNHNKHYTADEFSHRFNVFKTNMEHIRKHNANSGAKYTLGPNEHSDLTWDEFRQAKFGVKHVDKSVRRSRNVDKLDEVTVANGASVDWRLKGVVTPVWDEYPCKRASWAFSAAGATEGVFALKSGTLVALSVQQLIDCSHEGNYGCNNGGFVDNAFQFIINNKGIASAAVYPYIAADGTCKKPNVAATISGFYDLNKGSESELLTAVTKQPVSVSVDPSPDFQHYSSGVFEGNCSSNDINAQAMLVVGYGTDKQGKDYWIVKNSWGVFWGEAGYIRMIRNQNICGIANEASYPVA